MNGYKDPNSGDWSMVICTDQPTSLTITVGKGLSDGPIHVWHSDAQEQFVREDDIQIAGGRCTVALQGDSLYTLSTTSGQCRGQPAHPIPTPQRFPFPFREDFESYSSGVTARYFADQKGTFEVWDEPSHGKCLRQIVPQQGIVWQYMAGVVMPYTVFGDPEWSDYALSCDVRLVGGHVEIGGRFGDQNKLDYRLILSSEGAWKLNYQEKTLAQGELQGFDSTRWHAVKIAFQGSVVRGYVDGRLLAEARDDSRSKGMAYLVSTYDGNLFDNVTVTEMPADRLTPSEEVKGISPIINASELLREVERPIRCQF